MLDLISKINRNLIYKKEYRKDMNRKNWDNEKKNENFNEHLIWGIVIPLIILVGALLMYLLLKHII